MCGRYYRRSDKQRIKEAFRLGELPEGFVLPAMVPVGTIMVVKQESYPLWGRAVVGAEEDER
jgi:hypothetical protein